MSLTTIKIVGHTKSGKLTVWYKTDDEVSKARDVNNKEELETLIKNEVLLHL